MQNILVAHFPSNLKVPKNVIAIADAKRDNVITWDEIINSEKINQPNYEDFSIFNKHRADLLRVAERWSTPGESVESYSASCIQLISIYRSWLKPQAIDVSLFYTAMPHRLKDLCLQVVLSEYSIPAFFTRKRQDLGRWILRDYTTNSYFISEIENENFNSNRIIYETFISNIIPKHDKEVTQKNLTAKYLIFASLKIASNMFKRLFFKGSTDVMGPDSRFINLIRWDFMHLRSLFSIKRRKQFYNILAIKPANIQSNSIVFFLPHQPEGNTDPEANEYADIFQSIAKIIKMFPDKKLYIKEHPASFNYMQNSEVSGSHKFRSRLLYKKLRAANYDLIEIDSTLNEFPKNTIVATVNGSVFLQARHFGLNALKLARSWYDFDMEINFISSSADQEKINSKILHLIKFSFSNKKEILDNILRKFSI